MSKYSKAVVAVVGAVVAVADVFGAVIPVDVSDSAVALVTALLVYIVPND